jgi:hypothetical protein
MAEKCKNTDVKAWVLEFMHIGLSAVDLGRFGFLPTYSARFNFPTVCKCSKSKIKLGFTLFAQCYWCFQKLHIANPVLYTVGF